MKKNKSPQFAKRKKAFDSVMEAYRSAKDTNGGLGAMVIDAGGRETMNPVRPTLTDFRADVDRVVNKCCPSRISRLRFRLAYIDYDSPDEIEMGKYADKIISTGKNNLEQGVGAEFIKRGIYPMYGKGGYFSTLRTARPRRSI